MDSFISRMLSYIPEIGVLFFAVSAGMLYIDAEAKKIINSSKNSQESIRVRKSTMNKRIINVALLAIATLSPIWGVFIVFLSCDLTISQCCITALIAFILFAIAVFILYIFYRGNLYFYDLEKFMDAHPLYILYLRGFDRDVLFNKKRTTMHINKGSFSEYMFCKNVPSKYVCAAIGMTKELDAPLGCRRVYVDDNTWKSNVESLMQEAYVIYILINDSESCIWEISQSAAHKSKVIYIVDDYDCYCRVRHDIIHLIRLPEIDNNYRIDKTHFVVICNINGEFKLMTIENNSAGYKKFIGDTIINN